LLACLQKIRKQVVDSHGACCVDIARAADESAGSSSKTADASFASAPNVVNLMMRLSNVKDRDVAINKVALEAKHAKDTVTRKTEVQDLKQVMKRP